MTEPAAAEAPIQAYTLAPALRERAESYAHAQHLIYAVDTLWGLVSLILLLRLQLAPRLQRLAERLTRRRFLQAYVFTPLFVLATGLLALPTGVWAHRVERRFGLSIQGWGSFARDWTIGLAIDVVLGTLLVWLIYAVMRRAPRRWWLWAWAALLPVLLFVFFIAPLVIEPLFFKFSPLAARQPELAAQLHAIALRGGKDIPLERMFVMDASEKVRAVNAYVTGLGASKRVVVWDTTLAAMTPREISFVFGHELGHYVLGHVVIALCLAAVGLLLALWLAARVLALLLPRWGIARVDELASLPAILLVATLLATAATPIGAAFSRHQEHAADAFGVRVIDGVVADPPQAAAHAFQRLGEIDLSEVDPSPLVVLWFYDHPPIRDRVRFVLGGR